MQVIAEDPWNWFLFEDGEQLYLDVLVENGAVSFSVASGLTPEQARRFRRTGVTSLAPVADELRRKGLMRTWRITPLPADWAERSAAAVHEWKRRAEGSRP